MFAVKPLILALFVAASSVDASRSVPVRKLKYHGGGGGKSDKTMTPEMIAEEVEYIMSDGKAGKLPYGGSTVDIETVHIEETTYTMSDGKAGKPSSGGGGGGKSGKHVVTHPPNDMSMSLPLRPTPAGSPPVYVTVGKSGKDESSGSGNSIGASKASKPSSGEAGDYASSSSGAKAGKPSSSGGGGGGGGSSAGKANKSSSGGGGKSSKSALPDLSMSMSMIFSHAPTHIAAFGGKGGKHITNIYVKTPSSSTSAGKSGKAGSSSPLIVGEVTVDTNEPKTKSGKSSSTASASSAGNGISSSGGSSSSGSSGGKGKAGKNPSSSPTIESSVVNGTDTTQDGTTDEIETLLTLSPTPAVALKVAPAPGVPTGSRPTGQTPSFTKRPTDKEINSDSPTFFPTVYDANYDMNTNAGDKFVAITPFAVKLHANHPAPKYDEDTVKEVTMEHLVHSFRNSDGGYVLNRLNLMILDPEGERRHLASYNVYELVFGGILYFDKDSAIPTADEIDAVVKMSFTGERLKYYIDLLQEAGLDIGSGSWDASLVKPHLEPSGGSSTWKIVTIGLAGAIGGLVLLASGARLFYKKRQSKLFNEMDDVERGYVIKLKDEEEIEEFPGINTCPSTVANTIEDDRSLPSTVGRDHTLSSSSHDALEEQQAFDPSISPLEEPSDENAPTRYISVFTVKKDVQGKSLDEIDLRSLAIAYLSKMLKKFPNTYLLPYDKESSLSAITNIRNIPDDLEELEQYVGNARVDENTGKVLFNLRVESDMPVSKMKSGGKKSKVPVPPPPAPLSPQEIEEQKEEEKEEDIREIEGKGFEDVAI